MAQHEHSVYDTDPHYKIDAHTRVITDQSETPTKLMQHDHNSERFTFELDRFIDGHDMTLCNKVEVHYINIDASTKESNDGVYKVEDIGISPAGEDVVIFSWLVSKKATKYAGTLNFRLRFACVDENAKVVYAWHTEIFKGIAVSNGIDNAETVHEEYSDILEAWKTEILADVTEVADRAEALEENSRVILESATQQAQLAMTAAEAAEASAEEAATTAETLVIYIDEQLNGVEEELQMINEGGVE